MSTNDQICSHYDRLCVCGDEERVAVQLVGTDGNVFAIIGAVSRALRDAGQVALAEAFRERAFAAGSYDEVLRLCIEVCDVE